jgi:hypothetical protein
MFVLSIKDRNKKKKPISMGFFIAEMQQVGYKLRF